MHAPDQGGMNGVRMCIKCARARCEAGAGQGCLGDTSFSKQSSYIASIE